MTYANPDRLVVGVIIGVLATLLAMMILAAVWSDTYFRHDDSDRSDDTD